MKNFPFKNLRAVRARLLISGLLLLISLFVLLPIQAQDVTPSEGISTVAAPLPQTGDDTTVIVTAPADSLSALPAPLTYVIVIVLAVLLVGAMMYGGYLTRFLAKLVPPETASAIYASGVRFGLQVALNQAAQTPGTLDDEFFEEMARLRGLQVIKRADGSYEVTHTVTSPRMPV